MNDTFLLNEMKTIQAIYIVSDQKLENANHLLLTIKYYDIECHKRL